MNLYAAPPWDDLLPEEQGFVAGLGLLGADLPVTGRLVATAAERVAAALRALRALSREERAAALHGLLRGTAVAYPRGFFNLHPSWIEEALSDEPIELVLALSDGAPGIVQSAALAVARSRGLALEQASARTLEPDLRNELARFLFSELERLCEGPVGTLGARLRALSFDGLLDEVGRWGARTLGQSLHGAPAEAKARAMATVGDPWAEEIGRAASAAIDEITRERGRRWVREASAGEAGTPLERLRQIGLGALGDALAPEGWASIAAVAGRLPASLGRAWLVRLNLLP